MADNDKIVFDGKADEKPGMEPGDLVFVVQQKEKHPVFVRKGMDLFCKKDVSLRDALCGTVLTIKHLDKRVLSIKTEPGEVIKPGEFRCIEDEGMPQKNNPMLKGNLYVEFNVVFPKPGDLKGPTVDILKQALPSSEQMDVDGDEVEEVDMHTVDIENELRRRKEQFRQEQDDGSDDEAGGGQRVQCAQQ